MVTQRFSTPRTTGQLTQAPVLKNGCQGGERRGPCRCLSHPSRYGHHGEWQDLPGGQETRETHLAQAHQEGLRVLEHRNC